MACKKRSKSPVPSTSTSTSASVDLGMFIFMPNEKCFIQEPDGVMYEAKVTNVEMRNGEPMYYVHYPGWNKSWDRWVFAEDLQPYNDYTVMKAKNSRQKANKEKKDKKLKLKLKAAKEKTLLHSNQVQGRSTNDDVDTSSNLEGDDNFDKFLHYSVQMYKNFLKQTDLICNVPDSLDVTMADGQYLLFDDDNSRVRIPNYIVDDYVPSSYSTKIKISDCLGDFMSMDFYMEDECQKCVSIPAHCTVKDFFDSYQRDRLAATTDDDCLMRRLCGSKYEKILKKFTIGLADYFDAMLPKRLLFNMEKPKYLEIFYPPDDEWTIDYKTLQNIVLDEKPLKRIRKSSFQVLSNHSSEQCGESTQDSVESKTNKKKTTKIVIKEQNIVSDKQISNAQVNGKLFEIDDLTESESENELSKSDSKLVEKMEIGPIITKVNLTSSYEETVEAILSNDKKSKFELTVLMDTPIMEDLFKRLILFAYNKQKCPALDVLVSKIIKFFEEKQYSLQSLQVFHHLLSQRLEPICSNTIMAEQLWINFLVLRNLYQKTQQNKNTKKMFAQKNCDKTLTQVRARYKMHVTAPVSEKNLISTTNQTIETSGQTVDTEQQTNSTTNLKIKDKMNQPNPTSNLNNNEKTVRIVTRSQKRKCEELVYTPDSESSSPCKVFERSHITENNVSNSTTTTETFSSIELGRNPLNLLAEVSLLVPEDTNQISEQQNNQINPLDLLAEVGSSQSKLTVQPRQRARGSCKFCVAHIDLSLHHSYAKKWCETVDYIPRELRLKVNSTKVKRPKRLARNTAKLPTKRTRSIVNGSTNVSTDDSEATATATESGSDDDHQNERFQNSILKKTKKIYPIYPICLLPQTSQVKKRKKTRFNKYIEFAISKENSTKISKIYTKKLSKVKINKSSFLYFEGLNSITSVRLGRKSIRLLEAPFNQNKPVPIVQFPSPEIIWFSQLESLEAEDKIPRSSHCQSQEAIEYEQQSEDNCQKSQEKFQSASTLTTTSSNIDKTETFQTDLEQVDQVSTRSKYTKTDNVDSDNEVLSTSSASELQVQSDADSADKSEKSSDLQLSQFLMWQDFGLRKSTRIKKLNSQSGPVSSSPSTSLTKDSITSHRRSTKCMIESATNCETESDCEIMSGAANEIKYKKWHNSDRKHKPSTSKLIKSTYKEFPELAEIHDILQMYENNSETQKQAEIQEWKEYKDFVRQRIKQLKEDTKSNYYHDEDIKKLKKCKQDIRTFANIIVELGLCKEFGKFEKFNLDTKRTAAIAVMETYNRIQQKQAQVFTGAKQEINCSFPLNIFNRKSNETTGVICDCDLIKEFKLKLEEIEEEKCNANTVCQYIEILNRKSIKATKDDATMNNTELVKEAPSTVYIPMDLAISKTVAVEYGKISRKKVGTLSCNLAVDALKYILQSNLLRKLLNENNQIDDDQYDATSFLFHIVELKAKHIDDLYRKRQEIPLNNLSSINIAEMTKKMQNELSSHPLFAIPCTIVGQTLKRENKPCSQILDRNFSYYSTLQTTLSTNASSNSSSQVNSLNTPRPSNSEVRTDSEVLEETIDYFSTLSQHEWKNLSLTKIKGFVYTYLIWSQLEPELLLPLFAKQGSDGFCKFRSKRLINTKQGFRFESCFPSFTHKYAWKLEKTKTNTYCFLRQTKALMLYHKLIDLLQMIDVLESMKQLDIYHKSSSCNATNGRENALNQAESGKPINVPTMAEDTGALVTVQVFPPRKEDEPEDESKSKTYTLDEFEQITRSKWHELYDELMQSRVVEVSDTRSMIRYEQQMVPWLKVEVDERVQWTFNSLTQHESGAMVAPQHLYPPIHLLRLVYILTNHFSRVNASNPLLYLTWLFFLDLLQYMESHSTCWFGPQYYEDIDHLPLQRFLEPEELIDSN